MFKAIRLIRKEWDKRLRLRLRLRLRVIKELADWRIDGLRNSKYQYPNTKPALPKRQRAGR